MVAAGVSIVNGSAGEPTIGYSANTWVGSYEEWLTIAARSMAERYAAGDQAMLDALSGATGSIGQPVRADFGAAKPGVQYSISAQTYQFFEAYLRAYATSDPYIKQQFGVPPTTHATAIDQTAAQIASDEKIAAGNNATAISVANINAGASNYQADQQLAGIKLQVENDWAKAVMDDATRRYIAEGDWGVQKYIAELNNTGAMDRLKLELGQRDKELAQRAIEEKNRNHEAMIRLALDVAKYDAELGSQPRNWLAYASWLGNRDMVINGLTLATVANMIPENQISPAETASSGLPGSAMATVTQQQATESGQKSLLTPVGSGPQVDGFPDTSGNKPSLMTAPGVMKNSTAPASATGATSPGTAPTVSGIDLNSTDYAGIARSLLGITGNGSSQPTTADLQGAYDATGKAQGFGAWQGPTQNRLGMTVNPMGHKEDYRKFSDLLPSQQDMRISASGSVGKYEPDFVKEMQRSRPKGGVSGVAAYG